METPPWGLFYFDFDKDEFAVRCVDHIVLDPAGSIIGNASGQLGHRGVTVTIHDLQRSGCARNDDIIVFMAMPTCGSPRSKPPFGDAYPVIVDLYGGDSGGHVSGWALTPAFIAAANAGRARILVM